MIFQPGYEQDFNVADDQSIRLVIHRRIMVEE